MPVYTLDKLKQLNKIDRTSLGIVKPKRILDLKIDEITSEWKPEWQSLLGQLQLFAPQPKPLQKIPYRFRYIFECETGSVHKAVIEDWELGILFLKEQARLGNSEKAAESVKKKYFDQICAPDRDTKLFMGTRFPYNTWLVLGVFWPPRSERQ
jgi:hypothetical protein